MILELTHDGAQVMLRIEPDPRRERRALVHAHGHALSHAGTLAPGPLRELVLAVARQLASAADDGGVAALVEQLERLVATLAPAARLAIATPAIAAPPRWPSTLRTGSPPPDRLWPFDAELAGLRLGVRRLVKREAFDDDAEAADRAWLAAAGVATARVGPIDPDGRRVLLGALDPSALGDDVREAEARLRAGDDPAAARVLGEALGYPACCIDRFVAGGRDDRSLAARLADPGPPASPLTQWLNQPLALVSHVPCDLACAPTIALAAALLGELERATPTFAARWTALAARLHVLDQRGRGLALRGDGELAAGFRIEHAVVFQLPRRADLADLAVDAPDAAGRTLHAADVIASADHRG